MATHCALWKKRLASHRARDFRIGLQPPSPAMTRAGFVQRESAARWVWTRMGPAERQAERSMPARFDQVAEPALGPANGPPRTGDAGASGLNRRRANGRTVLLTSEHGNCPDGVPLVLRSSPASTKAWPAHRPSSGTRTEYRLYSFISVNRRAKPARQLPGHRRSNRRQDKGHGPDDAAVWLLPTTAPNKLRLGGREQ